MNRFSYILFMAVTLLLIGGVDKATQEALQVAHILKTIAAQPPRPDNQDRTAVITQRELNAYIAHRLKQEQKPFIQSLTVALEDRNEVRGTLKIDARKLNLGVLLGEALDFDFRGILHTRNHAGRIDLIALQLGGQPVDPQVLDFVLSTAGMVYQTEVGRVADWYELPKGVKTIVLKPAQAILHY